jgi:hypothetical protein
MEKKINKKINRPISHITANKREIKDFLKSRQVGISFVCNPLGENLCPINIKENH